MKILVDTDAGSDIDDALCLAYLLSRPDAEIVGVATVTGGPGERAKLVSAVTTFFGHDGIPICVGAANPLSGPQRQPEAPQAEALKRWDHASVFSEQPVEEFMRDLIAASPDEVVLMGIGPLTNVARLETRFPGTLGQLSRLVCMSGRFSNYQDMATVPEWNVLCDLEAARIVYAAAEATETLLVTSDVTRRLAMSRDDARERIVGLALELGPIVDMSEIWFATREKMTVHDGLAAALLFEPELCTYKRGRPVLDMETGATDWANDEQSRITATSDVDAERFFELFFDVLGEP